MSASILRIVGTASASRPGRRVVAAQHRHGVWSAGVRIHHLEQQKGRRKPAAL
jgi:hypothetical protein